MRQSIAKAKHAAWLEFSKYIRTKNASYNGMVQCVTCGAIYHWKKMQAGHFTDGRHNNTLFDVRNVHPQCLTKESKLKMADGSYKAIDKIEVGDNLTAFNESSFTHEQATVLRKEAFTPKELFEVEMQDGSKFYATHDHMVVSNGKWVRIMDMLHNVSENDIMSL